MWGGRKRAGLRAPSRAQTAEPGFSASQACPFQVLLKDLCQAPVRFPGQLRATLCALTVPNSPLDKSPPLYLQFNVSKIPEGRGRVCLNHHYIFSVSHGAGV